MDRGILTWVLEYIEAQRASCSLDCYFDEQGREIDFRRI